MSIEAIAGVDLSTIVGAVAQSQISVHGRKGSRTMEALPAGFDLRDVAILDWITAASAGPVDRPDGIVTVQ
jgi:hypothetical protein